MQADLKGSLVVPGTELNGTASVGLAANQLTAEMNLDVDETPYSFKLNVTPSSIEMNVDVIVNVVVDASVSTNMVQPAV